MILDVQDKEGRRILDIDGKGVEGEGSWAILHECHMSIIPLQLSAVIYGCMWTCIVATLKLLPYIPQLLKLFEFSDFQVWC